MWSAWQPDRGMPFNSYIFARDDGFVAVDPLPLDGESTDALRRGGGVHTVVLTNRDHERGASEFRERFGARVIAHSVEAPLFTVALDGTFEDGDEVFAGAFAVSLPFGKTKGEVALHLPAVKAAVVGDVLLGTPAGSLSVLPDAKLEDPRRFLFSLRRLWGLTLQTLLLCDGQPLFSDADAAIGALLEKRLGADANRINADEIRYATSRRPHGVYRVHDGEVGLPLGARKLGYRLARLDPGTAFCPLHWHVQAEEFFYVLEGQPAIRTLRGTIECRPGDFIAFPTGERGAHQLRNDSDASCLVLMVGMEDAAVGLEACFYPDSDKVGLWTSVEQLRMVRASPDLDYYDRE